MTIPNQWLLPHTVVTRSDVAKLQRELEALDNFLTQAAVRGGAQVGIPRTTAMFNELVNSNMLNMLKNEDRAKLDVFLQTLYAKAPTIHFSFSVEPSPLFLHRLTVWVRQNLSNYLLFEVGLHPGIGAGCAIMTNNKYYDFSLRQRFSDNKKLLVESIQKFQPPSPPAVAAAVPATLAEPAKQ